jgi:hypothetical protein
MKSSQITETKYALEALLAEIGTELPGNFIGRLMCIGEPYFDPRFKFSFFAAGRSRIYDHIDAIQYHSNHGSDIDEIKFEMKHLIDNIENLDTPSRI